MKYIYSKILRNFRKCELESRATTVHKAVSLGSSLKVIENFLCYIFYKIISRQGLRNTELRQKRAFIHPLIQPKSIETPTMCRSLSSFGILHTAFGRTVEN